MKLTDFFDINGKIDKRGRVANLTLRLFGLDFDIAVYGYLNDMVFPFMIVPGLRGLFVQSLFVAVFIGRLKEPS